MFTDGRTLLSDEELEMVVVLRMNRKFMDYMRKRKQQEVFQVKKEK